MVDHLRVVEFDYFFQGPEPTIVHVWSCEGDVPQGGSFEFTEILLPTGDGTYTRVRVGVFKSISENSVGDKVVGAVAVVTPPLAIEDSPPLVLLRGKVGKVGRPSEVELGFC